MKHILVALDLSHHADRAFERAFMLANEHKAELTIVHVINDNLVGYEDEDGSLAKTLMEKATRMLERYTAPLAADIKSRIKSHIVIGKAWEEIIVAADKGGADLIVIGLHHIRPMKDIFLGTTAERLIRNSTKPVLVVHDKPGGAYRSVVATTDFSPCSAHALSAGLELTPDAAFTLLHVFETPFPAHIKFSRKELEDYTRPKIEESQREANEAMEAFLKGHDARKASITPMLERNEIVTGIGKIIEQQKADLLVMGTHGRTGIAGAMLGSIALVFLNDPPCDVLVTH